MTKNFTVFIVLMMFSTFIFAQDCPATSNTLNTGCGSPAIRITSIGIGSGATIAGSTITATGTHNGNAVTNPTISQLNNNFVDICLNVPWPVGFLVGSFTLNLDNGIALDCSYDANGNLIMNPAGTFTWDFLNATAVPNCNAYPGITTLAQNETFTVDGTFTSTVSNIRVRHQVYSDFTFTNLVHESFTDHANPTSPFSLDHTIACDAPVNNGFAPPSLIGLIVDFTDGTSDSCFAYVGIASDGFTWDMLNNVAVPSNCNGYPGITTLEQGETFTVDGTFPACANVASIRVRHQVYSDFSFTNLVHESFTDHANPTSPYDLTHTIACDAPENNGFAPPSIVTVIAFDANGQPLGQCSAYVAISGGGFTWDFLNTTAVPNCNAYPGITTLEKGEPFTVDGTFSDCAIVANIRVRHQVYSDFTFSNLVHESFTDYPNLTSPYNLAHTISCDAPLNNGIAPPSIVGVIATDASGNVVGECFAYVGIDDTTLPEITCPPDITIECDASTAPVNTGSATASDNCDPAVTPTFNDVVIPGACLQESTIERTWTATDNAGNSTNCLQIITVLDTQGPVITCPADVVRNCDENTDPGSVGEATATDNCASAGNITIDFSDVSTQGQGCLAYSYLIIRTWTATDECGNQSTCSQAINVQDVVAPTITCPADIQVDCSDPTDPGFTGYATATGDNCASDDELLITFEDVSTQTPAGSGCSNDMYTITRTWTASDPCGNTSQCVQTITVVDGQMPEIFCPENVTIECDQSLDPSNTGTPVAADNCTSSDDIELTFSDVSTQTASGCGQYEYTITRTWTAMDACGNSANCIQTINVVDTTPPDIMCPPSVIIDCNDSTDPANTGSATAGADNCSAAAEVSVTFSDVVSQANAACATRTITRTWVATDACGNSSSCVQTINVSDTTAPTITCPPNQTLTCTESLPNAIGNAADFIAAGGTISDDCTASLSDFTVLVVNDDNGGDNCPGNARVVTRTYFIQDGCGNTSSCDQVFTYLESTVGPVITEIAPTCFKYCASLANPMESDITYTTDCSFGATVEITGPQVIGQENCPGTIYRYTYTVTDDCGRTTSATRDFVIGNEGPTIECAPFNLVLECGDPNNQDYIDQHLDLVTANTSCELGYTINHFPSFFNLTACGSATVVTFIATDDCGRTASCTTTIAIQDNNGPNITSTYVPDVCNEAICGSDLNFWFAEWKDKVFDNLTATDDCFPNIFWSTNPSSPFPNQNCPDESAETVVQFIATDQCGNTSYVEYSFYVVPAGGPEPGGAVMGTIETEQAEGVADVEVSLDGNGNMLYDYTEADGEYGFTGLELEQNYTVTPYHNNNPLNGVSTYDIVLMAKHILEIELLDSPYKMIAADINQSGTITTIDMVELRKLILFIDDEFANNTSWRFVEAAFIFPDATNPFATLFPEVVDINGLSADEIHDFVGIKIGDLNGSAQANATAEADDRTTTSHLVFQAENREVTAGQTYTVDFKASDFEAIHGYQFSLNFDANQLEFAGVRAGELNGLTEANFGTTLIERGVLTTSWNNQNAVSVVDGSTVFSVTFTAKVNGELSEMLQISPNYTSAEAYNKDLDLMGVDLRFDTDKVTGAAVKLYQNTPNPFKSTTTIGFELPKGGSATLRLFDHSGRTLKLIEGDYEKGYNEVTIDRGDLSATGVLYYQLETENNSTIRRMILLD